VPAGIEIPAKAYFKIGEVARLLGVKPYVLRYWETEFPRLRPQKGKTGQRTYTRADVALLVEIRHLLYERRFTIAGARKRLHGRERDAAPDLTPLLVRLCRELEELARLCDE
jgi:DNA-binding transcriptional MerR regulator